MILPEEDYLVHYGILRKSGRYPWGSGDNVTQRSKSFLDHIQKLKDQGLSDMMIAKGFGMTSTEYRAQRSIANHASKAADIAEAEKLKTKGYSNVAIGKKMGIGESSVRALLAPGVKDRNDVLLSTSNVLKSEIDKYGVPIDIGRGVENHLNISKDKLKVAIAVLESDGYKVHYVKIPQIAGGGQFTTRKVLAPPDMPYSEIYANQDKIRLINQRSDDGGRTYDGFMPPISINSKRVAIRYAEDGGDKEDGVIYVRPGVQDISLGQNRYAQVRIMVDGTHYLKGMAIYKDDLPKGTDLVFNTNKFKRDAPTKLSAMKKVSDDPDSPFEAIVDQIIKRDPAGNPIRTADGKTIVTSAMNIVGKEGDWQDWSRDLSAQMLSKQNSRLAKQQLDLTYKEKRAGLDEILQLTNPSVRQKLLKTYSDALDASAVHLEAAAMPRQGWHVILPISSMKNTEIYAPNYRNGERVALIRYPHGGIFEIPELIVNNNHREAKRILGQAQDAVGINSKVAQHLSGADFDGDTVLVIPNNRGQIKSAPILQGLKGFDTVAAYPHYEGMPRMKPKTKQNEMGLISNLITDMSIKGASQEELAQAVRHSMVVIDAEKHYLNYKQSAIDNGIPQLKEKYQGGKRAGSATLISLAGKKVDVPEHKPRRANEGGPIDKATGEKKFREQPESYVTKEGKLVIKTRKSKLLAETPDAFTLTSSPATPIEVIYATHSNKLKAMANEARKELVNTIPTKRSPSAARTYAKEVDSLNAKLNIALRNAPLERQAQLVANTIVSAKRLANPEMDDATLKKIESKALITARHRTGAEKQDIYITDAEWHAIQSNAISPSKLNQILDKANLSRVRELATPKTTTVMSANDRRRAEALLANGYTQAQVADTLGVSLTTLKTHLNGG